jgi:hypothetical protein
LIKSYLRHFDKARSHSHNFVEHPPGPPHSPLSKKSILFNFQIIQLTHQWHTKVCLCNTSTNKAQDTLKFYKNLKLCWRNSMKNIFEKKTIKFILCCNAITYQYKSSNLHCHNNNHELCNNDLCHHMLFQIPENHNSSRNYE